MSDTEAKILELIQGLTLAQQMDVLNHALAMLAAKQVRPQGRPPRAPVQQALIFLQTPGTATVSGVFRLMAFVGL